MCKGPKLRFEYAVVRGVFYLDLRCHIYTLHLCFAEGNVPQGTTFCSKAGQGGAGIWILFGMILGNFFKCVAVVSQCLVELVVSYLGLGVLW